MTVCVIVLAGGVGSRMKAEIPKQYLPLAGLPVARHCLDVFLSIPEVGQVVVVCDPSYRYHFEGLPVNFASPGVRRQDSLHNGLQSINKDITFVCVHDAARPCIDKEMVQKVIVAAQNHGAATLGMPVKFTIKEACGSNFVVNTPDRSHMWEIQTPQVIRLDLLRQGFEEAQKKNITVTDDVSLVELLNQPVKLVESSYTNIKITTPEDLLIAQLYISSIKYGSAKL